MSHLPVDGEEMINLPVPKRFFSVVVRALAKAMDDDDCPTTSGKVPLANVNDPPVQTATIDWTSVENCKKLRRELRYAGAIALLDLAAARPHMLVSFQEVVLSSGRSEKQVRADLGALTKAIKRLFNVETDDAIWPVEVRWAAGEKEQMYYLMQPEIAQAWTQSG